MMLLLLASACTSVRTDDSGQVAACSVSDFDATTGSGGFAAGGAMPVASLIDERSHDVCTSQFHGAPWVLNLRPMSSLPCQGVTADIGMIVSAFSEYQAVVVTLATTDMSGEAPTSAELVEFADAIEGPLLADPAGAFSRAALGENTPATFYVMDAEAAIVGHQDCYTTSEVCAALSDALDLEPGLECS